MGLSTQINWKKEEWPVVLPLHLSGRESRRGCTHGPCRGTISLHLSRTVSSLMGWNIARKYIYLYHRCVLYYLRLKPSPIPRSSGFLSQITSLPPANTLAWQIMLLSQAVHKNKLFWLHSKPVNESERKASSQICIWIIPGGTWRAGNLEA